MVAEEGRKGSPWIGVEILFVAETVVGRRWVESPLVEVVGRRVVVAVGRVEVVL